ANFGPRVDAGAGGQHVLDPGTAGIDQRAGFYGVTCSAGEVLHRDMPDTVGLPDLHGARAGADFGAAVVRIARGEHVEARGVDQTVGIFKTLFVAVRLQRLADLVTGKVD